MLPILYLNLLDHEGKTYIKFWHKPHPLLREKLKKAGWIKYSKKYKCFVMHHSPQAIAQTQHYFSGLGTVNTRYMHRPKRLQPLEKTTILALDGTAAPLPKKAELPVVHLAPIQIGSSTLISITHKYNSSIANLLKVLSTVKWQPQANCFCIPNNAQSLHSLVNNLMEIAQVWIGQNLQIKDLTLLAKLWE